MEIKRKFYIFLFTVLGLMFGFLMKEVIEILYVNLLIQDFAKYSFGLNWNDLTQLNYVFTLILLSICGFWGYAGGKFWWKQIYVYKHNLHKKWRGLYHR